jgi:hypothetical protein
VHHVIFAYRARERTTDVVVRMVLSEKTCRRAIHVGNGVKKEFTKLISISMKKSLVMRDRSALLTIVAVVIRDEISDGLSLIISLLSSSHTCTCITI